LLMLRKGSSQAAGYDRPVLHQQGDRHTMQILMRRRRRIVAGVLSGAVVATMAFASPAGASTTPAANNIIVGSGSSTTYSMMQALDTLFNSSLGCYMTQPSGTPQTYNFSCASNNSGDQVGEGYDDNPVNDVAFEQPALGSSAGIKQLEFGGTGNDGTCTPEPSCSSTTPTAVINFARSSRQFNGPLTSSPDYPGLNFVAYATDGVSAFTFPIVGSTQKACNTAKKNWTPSATVICPSNADAVSGSGATLTVADMTDIWNGTYKTWNAIPGFSTASSSGICVYTTQLSSGTEATWASALNFSSPTTLNAYVNSITSTTKPAGCKIPTGQTYGSSHTIFENSGKQIIQVGDEGNAIFFFSYGKFQVECVNPVTGNCADSKKNTPANLADLDGVVPSPTTILCTGSCTTPFPVVRDLFNAYSNGSYSPTSGQPGATEYGFPAATAATLNYVSEVGFLCKPQTDSPTSSTQVVDPVGGSGFRTEVDSVITSQGFIPFGLQTSEDQNPVDVSAETLLQAEDTSNTYTPNDPYINYGASKNSSLTDPAGYCEVWTTDGNPNP
jgi:ABC-type phosphate transport system substrate-binding protein